MYRTRYAKFCFRQRGERESDLEQQQQGQYGGKGKHITLAPLALTLGLRVTTAPLLQLSLLSSVSLRRLSIIARLPHLRPARHCRNLGNPRSSIPPPRRARLVVAVRQLSEPPIQERRRIMAAETDHGSGDEEI